MATKIELLSHEDKTLSPITKASNVLFENGKTAQDILNDKQDENFTPKITSSSSMFKVGQGDNADYSSNVANGAYESIVLKGKSMVNCIQEPSSQDVVLPYEFEDGQYVTINDTKETGALGVELKGQTLVNLATKTWAMGSTAQFNKDTTTLTTDTDKTWFSTTLKTVGMKAGGTYLLYTDSITYDTSLSSSPNLVSLVSLYEMKPNRNVGKFISNGAVKVTIPSDVDASDIGIRIHTTLEEGTGGVGKTTTVKGLMILEYQEGMENWDIPYFEGMTSCKMPTLHTVGKNLFDGELITGKIEDNGKPNTYVSTMCMSANYTRVQPNTTYNHKWIQELNSSRIFFYDANKNFIKKDENTISPTGGQFTTPSNCYYILFHLAVNTEMDSYTVLITKSNDLTYEPNKSSILSLPEEVVLRSLPNGVCDTFNTRTGEYVQRIGERILDGSESQWIHGSISPTNVFELPMTNMKRYTGVGQIICNTLPYSYTNLEVWDTYTGVSPLSARGDIVLRNNNTDTIQDLKAWLSQNPTTICYELKTPIVTKINLPSTLKSWNTTTHIYSEIPENTLYPTLSHSNPSYPVILKPSTKYSIVANSYSNDHTNSAINFNLGGATASTTVGNRVTTVTTLSTLSNELLTMGGRGNKLNNVMVIEGDVVGDESYFEGICDCKSPILSNVGKNLFDGELESGVLSLPSQGLKPNNVANNNYVRSTNKIPVLPNTVYAMSSEINSEWYVAFINQEGNYASTAKISSNSTGLTFTTPSDCYFIRFYKKSTDIKLRVQLEESSTPTTHEPYQSNTTTFDQKDGKTIVLRSLPSGVCDTLNVETGEYVQRIGEVVLDGSQNVASWWNTTSTIGVTISIPTMKNISNLVCDRLPVVYYGNINNDTYDTEGIASWDNGNVVRFRILKSKLTTEDVDGVKQYLAINPITVQYELTTPTVTTIDVQGFPHAYKDGHVQLSSGHSGQSLTPKVEYSLPTNRNGQIRSNQKMVEKHQKELDKLQAIVLANLVNSQYNQTLTTLNYELSRV